MKLPRLYKNDFTRLKIDVSSLRIWKVYFEYNTIKHRKYYFKLVIDKHGVLWYYNHVVKIIEN